MEPGGGKGHERVQEGEMEEDCCVELVANPCISRENSCKMIVVVGGLLFG